MEGQPADGSCIISLKNCKAKTKYLLIISVGPEAIIKGSVDIGPTHEPENLEKLRNYLKNIPKIRKL
jgi:hypothetical protein